MSALGGLLLLTVGFGALGGTGALVACCLRLRSAVSFVLAAYLIAWTEVVAVAFTLSAGRWVERWTLIGTYLAILGAAFLAWIASGRPAAPSISKAFRRSLEAAADPLVALPLLTSTGGLLYTLFVTLTTAPNDGDPLAYELTRAAFWRQEHGIVDLGATYFPLDYWPPVAETGSLVILTLSGTDKFSGLTQWLAVPMLALAVYGVGRRAGLDRRPALWSASLIPLFPVVITQSWAAFTDLVFSSFAVAGVYFGIGGLGIELVTFGLAIGLAVGTKYLGPILAPLFLLILAFAQPVSRWPAVAATALGGAGVASLWYLRTQLAEGDPVGNDGSGIQSREIAPIVTTFSRLSAEIFDLSGAYGRDIWLFSLVALVLVGVGLARRLQMRGGGQGLWIAAGVVAVTPHAVALVGRGYAYGGLKLGEALGRADLVDQLRDWEPSEVPDGAFSWFGPVGALMVVGGIPVAVWQIRRHSITRVALVLAAAPIVAIGLVSITISYQNHQGRYFVAALALCASTWGGFALTYRPVGAAIAILAAVTAGLCLVNSLGKPSGVGVLRGDPRSSVWTLPRWEQQGILRSTPPERDEVMTMRLVEERVPVNASIGVSLAHNSLVFPYFGADLGRTLTIVDEEDVLPPGIEWLVASPGRRLTGCRDAWQRERLGPYGWSVWRRSGPDTCSAVDTL